MSQKVKDGTSSPIEKLTLELEKEISMADISSFLSDEAAMEDKENQLRLIEN